MRKTILFVDDEPYILAGLKRMLRNLRQSMDLHFVESGEAALAHLAAHRVDVIVTDMRMPGIDGATLLNIVQEQYPQVIRFMLSGHSEQELVLRTVSSVHQFLTKPISPETLREVLHRACVYQDLIADDTLKQLISSVECLPSLPMVFVKLTQKLQNPDCSVQEIAAIIEEDLGICTKILQLVNSSFFGISRKIGSPAHAVSLLGIDLVKALVLFTGIFNEMQPDRHSDLSLQNLFHHSFRVAELTRMITHEEQQDKEAENNAFLAGLLHDIGKLLLTSILGQHYAEALRIGQKQSLAWYQAEQQILHTDHAAAGAYLLGLWGLPGPVVEAVIFHHQLDHYPVTAFSLAMAVHVADALDHQLQPVFTHLPSPELDTDSLMRAQVIDRLDRWMTLYGQITF